ncbi:galactose-binding domain-like protein [Aspergillus spectabilis]
MPRHLLRRHPTAPHPEPSSDSPQQPPPRQRLNHIPAQPQFQTPSPRGPPIPQLHPSSGPIEPSVDGVGASEPVRRAAAAHAALFSLFGRGVIGRPQGRDSMVEANEDDDYNDSQLGDEERDEEEDSDDAEMEGRIGVDEEGNEVELSEEEEMDGMAEGDMEDGDVEDDEDEIMQDRDKSPTPLPSDLREISSLASWTVSTHKPGCGVAALRNPDHTQYWQSDGPQPHTLSLHFFKLVPVVKIRVYLDFSLDESYTPTKMTFLAGMGGNDLVEFATWEGEGPCGWVDVPLDGVGGQNGGWVRKTRRPRRAQKPVRPQGRRDIGKGKSAGGIFVDDTLLSDSEDHGRSHWKYSHGHKMSVYDDEDDIHDGDDVDDDADDDDDDPYSGSVLKAMVIQMRVMENHQNGKDTHVRGFQVFARDDDRRRIGNAPSASADGRVRRHSVRKSLRGANDDDGRGDGNGDSDRGKVTGLEEPDWMGDPVIR